MSALGVRSAEPDPGVHTDLEIAPVRSRAERAAFVNLPYDAYRGQATWRAPLRFERKAQLDPRRNPGLAHLNYELFLARRGGRVVGRIAAIINPAHLEAHDPHGGHFGFLDTLEEDAGLVAALADKAGAWLEARGMHRMSGPFNFSVNEECGLLVEGFDTPPMLMMGHGRPDYGLALEACGFTKAMDLHAFIAHIGETYQRLPLTQRLVDRCAQDDRIEIRPIDMSRFEQEVALVLDIFNDAWSDNWGFIPFGEDQIHHMAKELRPLIRADAGWIGFVDGEAMAFGLILPNINEATEGLDGRLLPFGWLQLLNRLKVRGTQTARIPLSGMRKAHQKTRRGLAAFIGANDAALSAQSRHGLREIELSWVLETNQDLVGVIRLLKCEHYKTYRIYQRDLAAT